MKFDFALVKRIFERSPKQKMLSSLPAVEAKPSANASANASDDAIQAEFTRRFLAPISQDDTEHLVEGSWRESLAKSCAITYVIGSFAFAVSHPLAIAVLAGLGLRTLIVYPKIMNAMRVAGQQVTEALSVGDYKATTPALARWLEQNNNKLPELLDALEKLEGDFRRTKKIISRINRQGNLDGIKEDDIAFLRTQGHKGKLRPPLSIIYRPTSGYVLGGFKLTKLKNLIQQEIRRKAGNNVKTLHQIFGFGLGSKN